MAKIVMSSLNKSTIPIELSETFNIPISKKSWLRKSKNFGLSVYAVLYIK